MNDDQRLQDNIRRSAALHALKQMRRLVEAENTDDAFKARALRAVLRYGWIVLLGAGVLAAKLMGVF